MSWFRGIRNNSTKSKYGSLRERFRNIPRRLGRKLKTLKRYITGTGTRGSLLGTAKRIGSKIRRTITRKTNLKEPWKMRWQDSRPYLESLNNEQKMDVLTKLEPDQITTTLGEYEKLSDQQFNQRKNEIQRYIWGIIMVHTVISDTQRDFRVFNMEKINKIGEIINTLVSDYPKINNLVLEIGEKLANETKNQREANIHSLKNKIRMQRKKGCRHSFQPTGVKSQEDKNINNLIEKMTLRNASTAQSNVNQEETDEGLRAWEGRTQPNPRHFYGQGWHQAMLRTQEGSPELQWASAASPRGAASSLGAKQDGFNLFARLAHHLQKKADTAADAWLNLPDWLDRDDERQIAINAQKEADNARSGRIPLDEIVDSQRRTRLRKVYQVMNELNAPQ
jgi:Ni,Fe-hydrogenase I large subunit